MHQLILITAMSATTGLFGGKHCGKVKHHRAPAASCYSAAPGGASYAPAPCGGGSAPQPSTAYYPSTSMGSATPQMGPMTSPMMPATPQSAPGAPSAPSQPVPPAPAVPPAA